MKHRLFKKRKLSLSVSIVLLVIVVLFFTIIFFAVFAMILNQMNYISFGIGKKAMYIAKEHHFLVFLVNYLLISIFIGGALSHFLSKRMIRPMKELIAATHKVSEGDFNVKVELEGIRELSDLSQSFNRMTEELKSIETLRSEFVGNVSHEFKTPIVSIRGFAKLLKESDLPEEDREEYLNIIINESDRLSTLSANILNLAKYENMEIISEKRNFRLDEQIRQSVLLLEPKWSACGLRVELEMEDVIYHGNEDLTKQIWLNLIDNAIKFSYPGGMILISLRREPESLLFSIKDEGIGMDETTLSHIFDKFYQGDTSHATAGNGLGLSLARRIVTLMNGEIYADSKPESGTTFYVRLPSILQSK